MNDRPWASDHELLEDIARALRTTDDLGHTTWLDTAEHRIEILTFDPEDDPSELSDGDPGWMHEERALAQRILEGAGRYRRIYGTGTPGRLHDFIHSVRDAGLREDLWDASRRGRGAYRRVRGALRRRGLEQLWHDFEAAADRELALDWLRSEGLMTTSERANALDGTVPQCAAEGHVPESDLGPLVGTWNITEMELWSEEAIHKFEPAQIDIKPNGLGSIRFIAVQGDLDCHPGQRDGRPSVEWSWLGCDDSDDASGRGWCILREDGTLTGMICFHLGDCSTFHAVRK